MRIINKTTSPKIKKGKYYDITPVLNQDALYNIIFGGRDNGKSFSAKRYVIEDFYNTGAQFGYIRRWVDDVTAALARQYFADSPVDQFTNGDFNIIDAGRGFIELATYDPQADKKSNRQVCGYYFPISKASRFASNAYPDLKNVIIEEFIPIDGRYAPNEMELLNHLISTILRHHPDCKIFLICNSISRISPYWEEYEVGELIREMDIGDIYLIERDTKDGPQRIAIEYARPRPEGNKLFAGKRETMNVEGKWLADPHPHIDDLEKWQRVYSFYVKYKAATYKASYLVRGSEYTVYVEPYKDDIPKNSRIISDEFSFDPYVTTGFKPLSESEAAVFECIPSKCCYHDDLTGTEFEEIINAFLIM